MSSNRFNKILVIDSIPEDETNTAKRLFEDIETYTDAFPDSPFPEYIRIESGDDLIEVLSQCKELAISNDIYPMLHIECHGDENGFQFADKSILDWPELKEPLTELNIAMKLNLMVAVAACVGAAIVKTVTFTDRAPFWGMIGPTDTAMPNELETPFRALYQTLISEMSPSKAIAAFEDVAKEGLYWRTTAQGLFEKAWERYKSEYCTKVALDERLKRMQQQAPQYSKKQLKGMLQESEPKSFERFRNTFFMFDKFPENMERFSVEYKE